MVKEFIVTEVSLTYVGCRFRYASTYKYEEYAAEEYRCYACVSALLLRFEILRRNLIQYKTK